MSDFTKKMENIRKMMSNLKNEKYAIENQFLAEQDEYVKSLYMKVLCTVIQYDNNPTDMQVLFAERILKGISLEENFEDYMRKALDISETDMQEFFLHIGSNELKYYFALDGMLLVSMSKMKQTSYEYLAEVIELLGVNKDDLEYICLVAKSILQQESSYYDDAKKCLNERVARVDFSPYVKNYYAGVLVENNAMVYYSAPSKELSKNIEYPSQFRGKTIIFENLEITVTEEWQFEGCKEVIFKNCILIGGNKRINIASTEKFLVEDSVIKNFTNRFAYIKDVDIIRISNCNVADCGYAYEGYGSEFGGVFYIDGKCEETLIEHNKVTNCYIKTQSYCYAPFMYFVNYSNGGLSVISNEFTNCRCSGRRTEKSALICGNFNVLEYDDNKFVGELKTLLEDLY